MALHRADTDAQLPSDLGVGPATGQRGQDLGLPRGWVTDPAEADRLVLEQLSAEVGA